MYMALSQHDQASNQFYSGLGLLAAGMYPGRNPKASMQWAQGMQQDPNSMFNSLMQIHGMQQQQASLDAFNRSIPDMMKQTGLTADEIRANPQAATELVGKIAATNAGISSDPTMQEMNRAKGVYMAQNGITDPQDPRIPDKFKYPEQYKASVLTTEGQNKDVREAAQALPGYNTSLGDMSNRLSSIQAQAPIIQGILSDGKKQAAAQTLLAADPGSWAGIIAQHSGVLSDPELKAIGDLKQLKMQNYASNFKSGQRLTQQEALRLGQAADQISNLSVSPDTYMQNIADVGTKLGHARANAYGAAEDFDNLPMNLRPLMDPSYLKGGVNARETTPMPAWAKPVDVSDPKDLANLQQGQAYRIKSGPYAGVHYKGFRDDGTPDGTSQ